MWKDCVTASDLESRKWYEQTQMPPGGVEQRSRQRALLAGLLHVQATDPRRGELLASIEGSALCALRHDANPTAIAEARRALRIPLRLERVSDEQFDQLLRSAYEGGAGTLAMAGGGLEENADLEHLAQQTFTLVGLGCDR